MCLLFETLSIEYIYLVERMYHHR